MAPGLTSTGGRLPNDGKSRPVRGGQDQTEGQEGGVVKGDREFEEGEVVVVEAEGKEEACMVGMLSMGTGEVREKGKGVVIEGGHFLGDGLWRLEVG